MRMFGIIFNGGFAIVENTVTLAAVITTESQVEAWEFDCPEEAYVRLCGAYVEREYWGNPSAQIVLPRFEAFKDTPIFHKYGFVAQPVSVRFFAAVNPDTVGIFTRPEFVAEFLESYPRSVVKEFGSIADAQNWLNFAFLRYLLPISAYVAPVPYYAEIPLDVIFPVGFKDWWQAHCASLPSQLAFPQLPCGGES